MKYLFNTSHPFGTVDSLVQEWKGVVNKIGFQFHTPFAKGDPLWLPFGQERNKVVDELITLREKYPDFVINSKKQLTLMKGNWGELGPHQYNVLHGQFYPSIIWEERRNPAV
jgi:hypothetical protein